MGNCCCEVDEVDGVVVAGGKKCACCKCCKCGDACQCDPCECCKCENCECCKCDPCRAKCCKKDN